MKRATFGAAVILVILGAAVHWRPDRALKVASGLTAHNLCSAAFIAGLDPQATADELVKPMLPGFVLSAGTQFWNQRGSQSD